jgi:hypothetical protein
VCEGVRGCARVCEGVRGREQGSYCERSFFCFSVFCRAIFILYVRVSVRARYIYASKELYMKGLELSPTGDRPRASNIKSDSDRERERALSLSV